MNRLFRLPDFFIIGAAKCGTTDLASLLDRHPSIRLSRPKEPAFFCRDEMADDVEMLLWHGDEFWRSVDWDRHLDAILPAYSRLFKDIPADMLAAEASAWYFLSRRAPRRIHQLLPNAKLIAILREPAGRLISDYWFKVQGGRTCGDPEDYFYTKQATDGVRWGLYAKHLRRWLLRLPARSAPCRPVRAVHRARDEAAGGDGICRFLGVEPSLDAMRIATTRNQTAAPRSVRLELMLNLIRLRYKLPGSLSPAHEVRRPWGRKRRLIHTVVQAISRLNLTYDRRPPAWPPQLINGLQSYYRYENAGLSDLIGRDVNAIWYGRDRAGSAAPAAGPPGGWGAVAADPADRLPGHEIELSIGDHQLALR